MRTLFFLLQKEFIQIFRDRTMLFLLVLLPVIQLIILPRAATMELKKVRLSVVDHDRSSSSGRLIQKMLATGIFELVCYTGSYGQALKVVEGGKADCIVQFPLGFEKDLIGGKSGKMMLEMDAVNGVKAGSGSFYALQVINAYASERRQELGIQQGIPVVAGEPMAKFLPGEQREGHVVIPVLEGPGKAVSGKIQLEPNFRYNPGMDSKLFRIPAVIAMLICLLSGVLSSMNVVTEKESGTIEQMNVSPVRKSCFILSKLIPFWVIGLGILTLSLIIVYVMYGVVPAGSYLSIYVFSFLFLMAFVGFGMLISTFCSTQQQAMLLCFFFLMITCLLCGMWTPIRSMPGWAQVIAMVNPLRYYVEAMRLFFAFGSGLKDILPHVGMMVVFIVVFNGWAMWNYRKS